MGLIDVDVLMTDVRNTITEKSGVLDWINLINRQPTVCDVDKVIEELEAEQQKYAAQALETDDTDEVIRCVINEVAMRTAIDIVKRSGKE